MNKKSFKIILIIFGFLAVYVLLAGYLSLGQNKEIETNPSQPFLVRGGEETKDENQKLYVILNVAENSYLEEIQSGDTVFDVMQKIQSIKENNFSFNYKEYPGMGAFVEEINGIKNEPGKYWIYYINYEKADTGISNYILKDRDIISWRQE